MTADDALPGEGLPDEGLPDELVEAFAEMPEARAKFESLPPSHRREHVEYVAEARQPETRERRARRTVETLLDQPE